MTVNQEVMVEQEKINKLAIYLLNTSLDMYSRCVLIATQRIKSGVSDDHPAFGPEWAEYDRLRAELPAGGGYSRNLPNSKVKEI
jgi:hypothetical protein|tara:strand:- start:25416 stop:25667 length:252 start_codon:yes stop_codon:yes gene_type:complete